MRQADKKKIAKKKMYQQTALEDSFLIFHFSFVSVYYLNIVPDKALYTNDVQFRISGLESSFNDFLKYLHVLLPKTRGTRS